MNGLKKKLTISCLTIVFFLSMTFVPAQAQRASGDVGIGVQGGRPTGLSIRFYRPDGMNLDLLAAWDLDDFFFVNGHGLFESPLGDEGIAHVFYGPGAFIGIRDRGDDETLDNEIGIGISGTLGLGVMIDKLEIYGRITPRLELIEETDIDIGGGIGLRYYF